jgi:hypothetical protein
MRSHFALTQGMAVLAGATAGVTIATDVCEAVTIAADNASNPAYADGWQPGDNGGFGFSGWDMSGTYTSPIQHSLDGSSPYIHNQLGTAWTLFNPNAPGQGSPNLPADGTDISQAGRGFAPLQIGDTITTIIDNPTERRFFRGYTVRLNTGGGNTVYAGTPQTRLAIGTFEYFTYGRWYAGAASGIGGGGTSLLDTDTDAGLRIDVSLTGADEFTLTMTPLDNPAMAFLTSGTLAGSGPINWIEFELFNTDSDFHPSLADAPQATDFYIRSIEINNQATRVPESGTLPLLGAGAAALLLLRRRFLKGLRTSALALWCFRLVHG